VFVFVVVVVRMIGIVIYISGSIGTLWFFALLVLKSSLLVLKSKKTFALSGIMNVIVVREL
jgi:hypothetical protein